MNDDRYEATIYRHMNIAASGDEPTALAFTPDNYPEVRAYLAHGLNEPNALLEAARRAPLYRNFDGRWLPESEVEQDDTRETTVALAVESARRWAGRRDLSPELRLRRMWTVLTAALNG